MASSGPTLWNNAVAVANALPPMDQEQDDARSDTTSVAGNNPSALPPPRAQHNRGSAFRPTSGTQLGDAALSRTAYANKHLSQGSFSSVNDSRPTTANSRSHVPSITSRAFFSPMSSQRLQAHRNQQRPSSFLAHTRSNSYDTESEAQSRTRRNSMGSAITGDRTEPRYGLHTHYDEESQPPPSRGTERSGIQAVPPLPNSQFKNTEVTRGIMDGSQPPQAATLQKPGINPGSAHGPTEKSKTAPLPNNAKAHSPRAFISSWLQNGRSNVAGPANHAKLSSSDSSVMEKSVKKADQQQQQQQLGRNWEYFDGNTLFFLGGRLQTAKDRPIAVATAGLVILPSILWFVFTGPWLWHHVSPALPIFYAYFFYICMSSFFHASFSDPGILPRNLNPQPPQDPNADALALGPPSTEWIMVLSASGSHGAFEVPTKYCKSCDLWRPPRCHHCRVCDNCVDTQDHHCVWLNNCVGRRNYRFFYSFVGMTMVLAIFLFGTSIGQVSAYASQNSVSFGNAIDNNRVSFAMFFYGLIGFLYPLALWGYHCFLISRGQTTREYLNSNKFAKKDRHRPFNQNAWWRNLVVVLFRPRSPTFLDFKKRYQPGDQRFGERRGWTRKQSPSKATNSTGAVEMQQMSATPGFQGPTSRGWMNRTPRDDIDAVQRPARVAALGPVPYSCTDRFAMARLSRLDPIEASTPSSPRSEQSSVGLNSGSMSSTLASTNPTSRSSSTQSMFKTNSDGPNGTKRRSGRYSAGNGLFNTITTSKQNLLDDGIKALDMDWAMSPAPKEPTPDAKPLRKTSARLQGAAKAAASSLKETVSVLGKRSREAFESGKDAVKAASGKRQLRQRLSEAEKAERQKEEELKRKGPAPDVGNRPKLPIGWAYVHEPLKKKTRLNEAEEARRKKLEQLKEEDEEAARIFAESQGGSTTNKAKLPAKFSKIWVESGLYSGQAQTFNARDPGWKNREKRIKQYGALDEFEQKGTFMAYPMFCGEDMLRRGRHFRLPFDVFSPLAKEAKPEEWKRIRTNRFVGDAIHLWKHQAPHEVSQCLCTPDTGCGDNCLNRGMMYECDEKNCPLDAQTCTNRPFTSLAERVKTRKKYEIGVEVLHTDNKGFGVRACRTFQENQIITEYAGEVITKEECERRMNNEYKGKSDFYLMEFNQSMIIDATKGSIARFVNHSCEPNCTMEQWVVHGKPRMAVFAKRDIMTGEELTYDYNFNPFSTKSIQTCHCGSTYCRGQIGPKYSTQKEKARLLVMDLEKEDRTNYLRQFAAPFPKYKPSQALAAAKQKLADLFGQTVEQFFSKKKDAMSKKRPIKVEDDTNAQEAPKRKKARVSSARSAPKTIPKRTSSIRQVTVTAKSPRSASRGRPSVRVSSTSTGGTTLVDDGIDVPEPVTSPQTSPAPPGSSRRRSSVGLARHGSSSKRRSVRVVDDE